VSVRGVVSSELNTHRLAALAVSMTDPPPTLRRDLKSACWWPSRAEVGNSRKEVSDVLLTRPGDGLLPAVS
jgi:hypothetical protein